MDAVPEIHISFTKGTYCSDKNLNYVKPSIPNNTVDNKTMLLIHNSKWIFKHIDNPVIDIGYHLKDLVSCEFAVLHYLRKNGEKDEVQDILRDNDVEMDNTTESSRSGDEDESTGVEQDDDDQWCDFSKLEHVQTSILGRSSFLKGVTEQMKYFMQRALNAMLHQLYVDVIETIVEHGISPKMEVNSHLTELERVKLRNAKKYANVSLRAYLL